MVFSFIRLFVILTSSPHPLIFSSFNLFIPQLFHQFPSAVTLYVTKFYKSFISNNNGFVVIFRKSNGIAYFSYDL